MPADKPRHLQNSRDLALSIVPLVLICLALAGLSRACTFSPGGPTEAAPLTIDANDALARSAQSQSFPVRAPALPEGWVANSSSTVRIGDDSSVRVGFITESGGYLRLAQSGAPVDALVPGEVEGLTPADGSGSKQVGGRDWEIYAQQGAERAWVTDLGDVRLLVTGSGTDAEFGDLAGSVLIQEPLDG